MAKGLTMGTSLTLIKAGSEPTNLVIKGLTSIGPITGEKEEIEVTTLDSPDGAKEFLSGAADWGSQDLEGYMDDDTQIEKLRALFDSGMVRDWEILTPGKRKIAYKAFVKNFTYGEKTVDGVDGFKLTLRLSGKPTFSKVA